jgi:serine/threonine protein kinase
MSLIDPVTNDKYIIGKYLGKGMSSIVHLITKESDGELYAVKIIDTSVENFNTDFVQNEINIHIKLKHPNILNMQLSFFEPNNIKFYIITEYCVNDNLKKLLNSRKKLEYSEIRRCILQLSNGLKYLHMNGIMHRDIKLANILLDSELNLKIADFGFATTEAMSHTLIGTPNYIAPEILAKQYYDYKVDIWSFGVVVYILTVGQEPFKTDTIKELYKKIIKFDYNSFPIDIDLDLKNLIDRIFKHRNIRLSLEEIENHPFMKNGEIATTLNYV